MGSDTNNGHHLVALEFSSGGKVSLQNNGSLDEDEFIGDAAADEPAASGTLVDEASHINLLAQAWPKGY